MLETDEHICMRAAAIYQDPDNPTDQEIKDLLENLVWRLDLTKDVCAQQREELNKVREGLFKDKEIAMLKKENESLRMNIKDKLGLSPSQREHVDRWIKEHEEEGAGYLHSYRYCLYPMGDSGHYMCTEISCSCGAKVILP